MSYEQHPALNICIYFSLMFYDKTICTWHVQSIVVLKLNLTNCSYNIKNKIVYVPAKMYIPFYLYQY